MTGRDTARGRARRRPGGRAPGDDLAALLLAAVELADGDVVVVTSKVVSKAEGRVRPGTREEALPGETARVVARRGPTTIVRTHHGLTLAAAGIDASNVGPGTVVLLPEDPDASARALRAALARAHRPQRRRHRDRHRRPRLARGPDRHRDRRRRAARGRGLRRPRPTPTATSWR